MKRQYELVNTETGKKYRAEEMSESYRRTRNNSLAALGSPWRWRRIDDEDDQ